RRPPPKYPGPAHEDQKTMETRRPKAPTHRTITPIVWMSTPLDWLTCTANARTAPTAMSKMPTPRPTWTTSFLYGGAAAGMAEGQNGRDQQQQEQQGMDGDAAPERDENDKERENQEHRSTSFSTGRM